MPDSTTQHPDQHSPRALAIRNAADACDAHEQQPDTHTQHHMQQAVQTALNLGATHADIRNARTKQTPAATADRGATVGQLHAAADTDYATGGDYRARMDARIRGGN